MRHNPYRRPSTHRPASLQRKAHRRTAVSSKAREEIQYILQMITRYENASDYSELDAISYALRDLEDELETDFDEIYELEDLHSLLEDATLEAFRLVERVRRVVQSL